MIGAVPRKFAISEVRIGPLQPYHRSPSLSCSYENLTILIQHVVVSPSFIDNTLLSISYLHQHA